MPTPKRVPSLPINQSIKTVNVDTSHAILIDKYNTPPSTILTRVIQNTNKLKSYGAYHIANRIFITLASNYYTLSNHGLIVGYEYSAGHQIKRRYDLLPQLLMSRFIRPFHDSSALYKSRNEHHWHYDLVLLSCNNQIINIPRPKLHPALVGALLMTIINKPDQWIEKWSHERKITPSPDRQLIDDLYENIKHDLNDLNIHLCAYAVSGI